MPEPLPRPAPPVIRAARSRVRIEDFHVDELPAFDPEGSGEHLLLTLEKRGLNTRALIDHVARWAGVPASAVGHAGLKDRHAVTTQRLSVWLPKRKSPDVADLETDAIRVVESVWHSRKLHPGALAGNRFELVLREVAMDADALPARIAAIRAHGVPNYFGEQRFGRDGDNVEQARRMFAGQRVGRDIRSLLLSAVRSELFNAVLAKRVEAGQWITALAGDVFMLDGTQSIFGPVPLDDDLSRRLKEGDIHTTGPMWGRGDLRTTDTARELETVVLDDPQYADLREGLEAAGLKQERRSLRLPVRDLQATQKQDTLHLTFSLPPGSYATTVLHALGDIEDATREKGGQIHFS